MPLFSGTTQAKTQAVHPDCGACGLSAKCKHPKQSPWVTDSTTVIVADGPTVDTEDGVRRSPYNRLRSLLMRVGHGLGQYTIIPGQACPGSNDEAWRHCQPLVAQAIQKLKPVNIITFGQEATASVIGWASEQPAGLPDRWYGHQIPFQGWNAWICPVGPIGYQKGNAAVTDLWMYRHIRAALALKHRPYAVVPDFNKHVRVLMSVPDIISALQAASKAEAVCFDYETTGLKPQWDGHEIVTCSLAWYEGETLKCVAFPLYYETHDALRAFLLSPARKITHNQQYEYIWSTVILGVKPVNMWWDTMLAAHHDDPQEATKSLDYQAFVHLGFPEWTKGVDAFFKTAAANEINNIHAAPLHQLLVYNGFDTITGLLIAASQQRELGAPEIIPSTHLPRHHNADISA